MCPCLIRRYDNIIQYKTHSSAVIGNTVFGRGEFKDIKNNFIIDKRALDLLLIDSPWPVWFYALPETESIVLVESSKDINATLDVI